MQKDQPQTQTQPKTADLNVEPMGNGQPDHPCPDNRTTAIFPPLRTDDKRDVQPAQDCVDEALMESFPCSDPPCYPRSHAC
jgi:hypothetical protein